MKRNFALVWLLTPLLSTPVFSREVYSGDQSEELEAHLQKRTDVSDTSRPVMYEATPEYFRGKYEDNLQAGKLRKARQNQVRHEIAQSGDPVWLGQYVSYYNNSLDGLRSRVNKHESKRVRSMDKARMWDDLASRHYQGEGATNEQIERHLKENPDAVDHASVLEEEEDYAAMGRGEVPASQRRRMTMREMRERLEDSRMGSDGLDSDYKSYRRLSNERRRNYRLRDQREGEDARGRGLTSPETSGPKSKFLQAKAADLTQSEAKHFDMERNHRRMKNMERKMAREMDTEKIEKLQRGIDKGKLREKAILDRDINAMHQLSQTYVEASQRHEAKANQIRESRPRLLAKKKAWEKQVEMATIHQ